MKNVKYSEDDSGNIFIDNSRSLQEAVENFCDKKVTKKEAQEYARLRRKQFVFFQTRNEMRQEEIERLEEEAKKYEFSENGM